MYSQHQIKFISGSNRITVTDPATKTFQIVCGNETSTYSSPDIDAVVIKTTDTGPSVEDMYAEIYIKNVIYIIPSENPTFQETILDTIQSIVPLNLELFIAASMHHFNKTFVLYQKPDAVVNVEDNDEKRAAIIEAAAKTIAENDPAPALNSFIFAMLSFCPMYLLYGTGTHQDQLVTLNAISDNLIPIFTSLERCPEGPPFEKRKLSADAYITLLASRNYEAVINFRSDCQLTISSKQLQKILLPLILIRAEDANPKPAPKEPDNKKPGFFAKLFGKK